MEIIELHGMEFFAHHGYYHEEQLIGNYFYVDITVEADLSKAIESDCLEDTINYQQVYDLVKREMEIPSRLLEHLAGRIVNTLYTNIPDIKQLSVKVTKENPPLGGKVKNAIVQLIR
jgi:dihydroneopterin aldolase